MSNYDIYKYASEFSTGTVSMALLDYVLYGKNMNQAIYDGALFGLSVTGSCWLIDFIVHLN